MELWIVGKNLNYELESWEFQGIYSEKQLAINRCEDDNWWIAKVKVDEFVPTETVEFKESLYPIQ